MMKKMISLAMAAVMLLALVACGGNGNTATGKGFAVDSTTALLETVWNSYADGEKFFVMGGDYDNNVADGPGKFNHENAEYMDGMLGVPESVTAMVDDGASMIHAMNANTFTAGAFHLTDAGNTDAFVSAVKENIMNRQWMCGFPDKLVIVSDGNGYVVSAFGKTEGIDTFKSKLVELGGTVVVEENIE